MNKYRFLAQSSALLSFTILLVACGGGGGNGTATTDTGDVDNQAPAATIIFPPRVSSTDSGLVKVTGTATDNGTITVVRVNGTDATSSDNFANWQANVSLDPGANTLTVETGDMALNSDTNATSVSISFNGSALLRPFEIALDAANNRALVVETPLSGASKGIASIDLNSGTRTTFSNATTPDTGNPFTFPSSVAIDSVNSRVLVADFQAATIFTLDSTGARTVFSDATTPDAADPFSFPSGVLVDSVNNRIFVLDSPKVFSINPVSGARSLVTDQLTVNASSMVVDNTNSRLLVLDNVSSNQQIIAIDLTPGATFGNKSIFSDDIIPDSLNKLVDPIDIDIDTTNNRALVSNNTNKTITAVNLTSGVRTVLSDNTTPDTSTPFSDISGIVVDSANSRALVVNASAIFSVNLITGVRTELTNTSTPDDINPFASPSDTVFDAANNRVLVTDATLKAVIAIDTTTGTRTILSDGVTPDITNTFGAPAGLALDAVNNRALVLDEIKQAVIAVSLTDGSRTILSDNTINAGVTPFSVPNGGIVFDDANNRTLVIDSNDVIAVDNVGVRSVFANGFTGALTGISIDTTSARALVIDPIDKAVIAVSLSDGSKSVLSDATTPDGNNVLSSPSDITIDTANNRALVSDSGLDAVIAVDLTTGVRTVVSSVNIPDTANSFIFPRGLAIDSSTGHILVIDTSLQALVAVDPMTGSRVLLSK